MSQHSAVPPLQDPGHVHQTVCLSLTNKALPRKNLPQVHKTQTRSQMWQVKRQALGACHGVGANTGLLDEQTLC